MVGGGRDILSGQKCCWPQTIIRKWWRDTVEKEITNQDGYRCFNPFDGSKSSEFENVLSNEINHTFLCFESFKFEACWCTDLQCWSSRSIICWCVGNDSWLELGYQWCSRGVSPAGIPWSYIIWKQLSVWDRKWTVMAWKREMSGEWIQFRRMFKRYPGVSEWPLLFIGNGPV